MNSSIYKKVVTLEDHRTYYDLLTPSWIEMGYELECVLGEVSRYIILNEERKAVGTFEILPYDADKKSYLDETFPFKEFIKEYHGKVIELDGLSIHPDFRKENNLERILYSTIEHARIHKIKYVIGVINPALYVALRNTFKIPIQKIEELLIKDIQFTHV